MFSQNLLAYIPILNQRHLAWFEKYSKSHLLLISQADAEKLLPRLARNLAAIPTSMTMRMIASEHMVERVDIFRPEEHVTPSSFAGRDWVLPDEDISHLVAEKYLLPAGCDVVYEMIWARWDMTAVHKMQPVISDVEISTDEFDVKFLRKVHAYAEHSPDWWRRVGAAAVSKDGKLLATACNTHLPNEYETYIFGDPSLNRDAGQEGKSCALHAEDAVITQCARYGLAVEGGKMYVSTFPCESCARKIGFSGIRTVYFCDGYSSLNAQEVLRSRGVRIVQVKE